MKRVIGVGGVFFKARDAEALRAWYLTHLGIEIDPSWGGFAFEGEGTTVFAIFKDDSASFAPSTSPFMLNFRVDDLKSLLAVLRAEGCAVDEKTESSPEAGDFGWVMDPEGNRVELWQPPKKP